MAEYSIKRCTGRPICRLKTDLCTTVAQQSIKELYQQCLFPTNRLVLIVFQLLEDMSGL